MFFENNSKILFIGDSITDRGRDRSTNGKDLGAGYVSQIAQTLRGQNPEVDVEIFNFGVSGNRVTDLETRWEADVLQHDPDYVSIMIGINDVWRQFKRPEIEQVDLESYKSRLEGLVVRTLPEVKSMIILSPYYLELDRQEPMRKLMDEYGAAARGIAVRHRLLFVDVQSAFDNWMEHNSWQEISEDRIHMSPAGHQVIASAFLDAVGTGG